jgi:hypothetical protein
VASAGLLRARRWDLRRRADELEDVEPCDALGACWFRVIGWGRGRYWGDLWEKEDRIIVVGCYGVSRRRFIKGFLRGVLFVEKGKN